MVIFIHIQSTLFKPLRGRSRPRRFNGVCVGIAPHEDAGWLLVWEAATCAVGAGLSPYVCLGDCLGLSICLSRSGRTHRRTHSLGLSVLAVCLGWSVSVGLSRSVCLGLSVSVCLYRSVSLSVSFGQRARTNAPTMSTIAVSPELHNRRCKRLPPKPYGRTENLTHGMIFFPFSKLIKKSRSRL